MSGNGDRQDAEVVEAMRDPRFRDLLLQYAQGTTTGGPPEDGRHNDTDHGRDTGVPPPPSSSGAHSEPPTVDAHTFGDIKDSVSLVRAPKGGFVVRVLRATTTNTSQSSEIYINMCSYEAIEEPHITPQGWAVPFILGPEHISAEGHCSVTTFDAVFSSRTIKKAKEDKETWLLLVETAFDAVDSSHYKLSRSGIMTVQGVKYKGNNLPVLAQHVLGIQGHNPHITQPQSGNVENSPQPSSHFPHCRDGASKAKPQTLYHCADFNLLPPPSSSIFPHDYHPQAELSLPVPSSQLKRIITPSYSYHQTNLNAVVMVWWKGLKVLDITQCNDTSARCISLSVHLGIQNIHRMTPSEVELAYFCQKVEITLESEISPSSVKISTLCEGGIGRIIVVTRKIIPGLWLKTPVQCVCVD
ncbi:hypothetical protein Pelo_4706 [Pelomyxa schiedti]|nr:hypothetical protein Pelo_4706 [Pelomyxa schiedti]